MVGWRREVERRDADGEVDYQGVYLEFVLEGMRGTGSLDISVGRVEGDVSGLTIGGRCSEREAWKAGVFLSRRKKWLGVREVVRVAKLGGEGL